MFATSTTNIHNMITVRQKFESVLVERGMFPEQAKTVMNLAITEIDSSGIGQITWNRPADEYPSSIYAVLMLTVEKVALEWIDANMPMAWFRPMFDREQMKSIMDQQQGKQDK